MATLIKLPSGRKMNLDNFTITNAAGYEVRFVGGEYADLGEKDRNVLEAWLDWQARDIEAELAGRNPSVGVGDFVAFDWGRGEWHAGQVDFIAHDDRYLHVMCEYAGYSVRRDDLTLRRFDTLETATEYVIEQNDKEG